MISKSTNSIPYLDLYEDADTWLAKIPESELHEPQREMLRIFMKRPGNTPVSPKELRQAAVLAITGVPYGTVKPAVIGGVLYSLGKLPWVRYLPDHKGVYRMHISQLGFFEGSYGEMFQRVHELLQELADLWKAGSLLVEGEAIRGYTHSVRGDELHDLAITEMEALYHWFKYHREPLVSYVSAAKLHLRGTLSELNNLNVKVRKVTRMGE